MKQMTRLTIILSDPEQALLLEEVAWNLSSVTDVTHDRDEPVTGQVAEPVEEYGTLTPLTAEDWIKPGRPATDEELEHLADEMMQDGEEFPIEESRERMENRIASWKQKHSR
jgi:hypothetical protein